MKGSESASGHTGSLNDDVFKSPARKKMGQAQGLRRSERIQHTTEDQDMQSSAVQQQGTELGVYNNSTKTTNRHNQQPRPKKLSSKQVVQGHLNLAQQPQHGKILMPTSAAAANNTNIINPSSSTTTTTTTTATSSTTSLTIMATPTPSVPTQSPAVTTTSGTNFQQEQQNSLNQIHMQLQVPAFFCSSFKQKYFLNLFK
jgi:hypothetical protein